MKFDCQIVWSMRMSLFWTSNSWALAFNLLRQSRAQWRRWIQRSAKPLKTRRWWRRPRPVPPSRRNCHCCVHPATLLCSYDNNMQCGNHFVWIYTTLNENGPSVFTYWFCQQHSRTVITGSFQTDMLNLLVALCPVFALVSSRAPVEG